MGIFGPPKQEAMTGAFDTIIGEQGSFKGELSSQGSVSINGNFEGKLNTQGELVIARGSKVIGEIKGGAVIVSGTVDGNITAAQSLEITKSGRVHGDLTGGKIVIEEGSSYRGKVNVVGEGVESSYAPGKNREASEDRPEEKEALPAETLIAEAPAEQTQML